jgi:chemotaxis protein MotB
MADKRPIIIIKRKSGHAGHHGGAWKVAYADFVTAMMALFIVLWLTSSGEKVKKSIAGYFNDPTGTSKEVGTDKIGEAENIPLDRKDISKLKERLQQQIAQKPDLKKLKDEIEFTITPEGMRIELIESKDGTFFESGSAVLNKTGQELLGLLAKELSTVPNRVSLEGHTDAQQYAGVAKYDNWELSTDRANAARRLMQTTGLQPNQLAQVRGFADQQPRMPAAPMDPSNRRVSVIVHYIGFATSAPVVKSAATGKDAGVGAGKPVVEKAAVESAPTSGPGTVPAAPGKMPAAPASAAIAKPGLLHAIPSAHDATAWFQKVSGSLLHHKAASTNAASTSAEAAPK